MGRAWSDEWRGFPGTVAVILVEFAFAFPTQEDDDAHGTQDPSTNETTDPEAVPVIVERTVFIFNAIGLQGRQNW